MLLGIYGYCVYMRVYLTYKILVVSYICIPYVSCQFLFRSERQKEHNSCFRVYTVDTQQQLKHIYLQSIDSQTIWNQIIQNTNKKSEMNLCL